MICENSKWKKFVISELFSIEKVKGKPIENYQKGTIPYISTSMFNNGLIDFVEYNDDAISKKYAISIDPINGKAFYHDYQFVGRGYSGASVNLLYNKYMNKYSALYICKMIELTSRSKASYGNLFNGKRLQNAVIILPADKNGAPDYCLMEEYVKGKMFEEIKKIKEYCNNRLKNIQYKNIVPLKAKKWCHFPISNICLIDSGIDIYDSERIEGKIPYITSTSTNNGIKYFVSNTNKTKSSGSISVNRNGSVGYAFYHKYEALYSNDCRKITLKKYNNEFVSLFITNQIMQQKSKYGYGYKMGTARLRKQQILLPVDENDSPDYEYMEQYIKNIMFEQYSRYLQFLED